MTAPFVPGPAGGASVAPDGDRWTLVLIRDLPYPADRVWAALTDPARLDQWAPFAASRPLTTPGEAVLTVIDGPDRTDTTTTVLRVEEPTLLEYEWGGDLLRWELVAHEAGTTLTLRHTFAERGNAAVYAAGWHLCVAVLAHFLADAPVGVIRGRDAMAHGWDELRAAYEKQL